MQFPNIPGKPTHLRRPQEYLRQHWYRDPGRAPFEGRPQRSRRVFTWKCLIERAEDGRMDHGKSGIYMDLWDLSDLTL